MDEVKVVVQAFAALQLQIGFAGLLVMPGFVRKAGFQSGEDMHQTGLLTALIQNSPNPVFFAKVLLANVLDFETIGLCQSFGVGTDLLPQRLRKLDIIENANVVCVKIARHPFGITPGLDAAGQDNPVITVQHAIYGVFVLLIQQFADHAVPPQSLDCENVTQFGPGDKIDVPTN